MDCVMVGHKKQKEIGFPVGSIEQCGGKYNIILPIFLM